MSLITNRHKAGEYLSNERHPDNPKEHYAVVRLIGDETINGLVRRFSHKDVFFLNKDEAPNVQ